MSSCQVFISAAMSLCLNLSGNYWSPKLHLYLCTLLQYKYAILKRLTYSYKTGLAVRVQHMAKVKMKHGVQWTVWHTVILCPGRSLSTDSWHTLDIQFIHYVQDSLYIVYRKGELSSIFVFLFHSIKSRKYSLLEEIIPWLSREEGCVISVTNLWLNYFVEEYVTDTPKKLDYWYWNVLKQYNTKI